MTKFLYCTTLTGILSQTHHIDTYIHVLYYLFYVEQVYVENVCSFLRSIKESFSEHLTHVSN